MLEDGTVFEGTGFGFPATAAGEVVFNTGMVGYTETLTDPSYRGQILCLTYPLIGNYGVPSPDVLDNFGLPKYFESDGIQVKALIIHELSDIASHWSCTKTLDEWLYEQKIPGIFGIDTRELTKKLRVNGVMKAALVVSDKPINNSDANEALKTADYDTLNFMPEVSTKAPVEYFCSSDRSASGKGRIVVIDTGVKNSIIRNILRTGYDVVRLPWNASFEEISSYHPKGVVISNGPGDPKVCSSTITTAARLIKTSTPTLGICLGNQILALAGGADTYKLKFGHRGQNKPCMDLRNSQVYVTSQNHGYGIDPESLSETGFKVWFSNADDKTVEGIEHKKLPVIAVQFHPEASPGPYDCMFVFDRFKDIIEKGSGETAELPSESKPPRKTATTKTGTARSIRNVSNRRRERKVAKK
ncbi:MAG: glutamine-hydrolyzing carbamoyl-phosphate synthase small subunit [Nitrososphaera sp.]